MLYVYVKRMSHPHIRWEDPYDATKRMGREAWDAIRWAGEQVGVADDVVQGLIREKVIGVPATGPTVAGMPAQLIASTPFSARPNSPIDTGYKYSPGLEGWASLVGGRGLQVGAVTGAGYALAQLTNQFGNSVADQPELGQLSLN